MSDWLVGYLLVAWALLRLTRPSPVRGVLLLLVLACGLPNAWHGVSALANLRSVIGDPSAVLLLLLGADLVRRLGGRELLGARSSEGLMAVLAVTALVFYPAAFGLVALDLYALGYGRWALPAALLLLTGFFWFSGRRAAAVILFGAVAAYDVGLLESTNLWDYLLDPFLALFALACGGRALLRRLRGRAS
ncbi:MAG: hypothetical protein ACYTEZ_02005 [Planctomycetota bacterium]